MILQPVVTGAGFGLYRIGQALTGIKNGTNPTFNTLDKFIHNGKVSIVLTWNGRRLLLDRDFIVQEAGGIGTGYNRIVLQWNASELLPRATDELVADYFIDASV